MQHFDWSHAWAGRLSRPVPTSPDAYARRLADALSAGTLPFLDLPFAEDLTEQLAGMESFFHRFRHMVVLGIGGSALGTRALQKAFFPQQDRPGHTGPYLWIMDNVNAGELAAMVDMLPPTETLVVVISKSGGTIETLAQYFFMRDWLRRTLGGTWADHLILITDAGKGFLREEAERLHCASLPVPEHLGGRYSVLSAVGLVPAAFMGLPWRELLAGARNVNATLVRHPQDAGSLLRHPAWQLAEWAFSLTRTNYNQLIFFTYIPDWAAFGQWFAQLWAESLGKEGKGTMPLPAVGVTDQHSLQQMFLDGPKDKGCIQVFAETQPQGAVFPADVPDQWDWLRGRRFGELLDAECLGTAAALAHNDVPLVRARLGVPDCQTAGELMGICMAATVFTGWLLDINPLDQPAVELGKRLAYARLGAPDYEEERRMLHHFSGENV